MKRLFFFITGFLLFSTASIAQDTLPSTDTTSCFLFMEVDHINAKSISIYHGDGRVEYLVPREVGKKERIGHKENFSRSIAEITNKLYKDGWRLVTVTDDNDEPTSIDVPRYYYFERVDCGE